MLTIRHALGAYYGDYSMPKWNVQENLTGFNKTIINPVHSTKDQISSYSISRKVYWQNYTLEQRN